MNIPNEPYEIPDTEVLARQREEIVSLTHRLAHANKRAKEADEAYEALNNERLEEEEPDDIQYKPPTIPFTLHQIYEEAKDTYQARCRHCQQTIFEVGCGSYYTVLRCVVCRKETCIHDG